ncbi:MAG: phosphate regulon sensor histidine kinase PhoR [Rhodospirillaceae bacterium]|nr:phosphate regulon sensor histidine kinase PhoR [Rhodospirillaceae bacterium]
MPERPRQKKDTELDTRLQNPANRSHGAQPRYVRVPRMTPKANHLFWATLALGLPGAAVLLVLMVTGHLAPGPGVIAIAVILGGAAAIIFRPLTRLHRLAHRLEALIDTLPDQQLDQDPPHESGAIGDAASALFRLERSWGRDRKQLRDGLKAAQILFDALPDPLITVDAQSRLVYANAAARALLAGRQGVNELAGRDLSAGIRQPSILQAVADVLNGMSPRTVEFTFTDRVDQSFEARVEPIVSEASKDGDARVLILMRDVTALRRGEQMRADFVANVSHELRTPLTSIVGFIETLRGLAKDDPEAQTRFLDLMETQSTRMTRIVNDLLSLSRIEMNEHERPNDEVNLHQTITMVVDLLTPQSYARDIKIELDLDALDGPVIGQADELAQLFQNLIENAIKYGRAGTAVRVAASLRDDIASVSVTDQGEGIPREHIARLTERFYRVDSTRSRELGGTGLGLAIVKHIANRHRSELTIRSELGVGSTFTVTLRRFG